MHESFIKLPEEKRNRIVMAGVREFAAYTYAEASTGRITEYGEISKGLLFHYFGNKRAFYLYCLETVIRTLSNAISDISEENMRLTEYSSFSDLIYAELETSLRVVSEYPFENRFLEMAKKEGYSAVCDEKDRMIHHYQASMKHIAEVNYHKALSRLKLKRVGDRMMMEGLFLYESALQNHYLEQYMDAPEQFFKNRDLIKEEITTYLNLMLEGIRR